MATLLVFFEIHFLQFIVFLVTIQQLTEYVGLTLSIGLVQDQKLLGLLLLPV